MTTGLLSLVFVVMSVAIVFLLFQVNDNTKRNVDVKLQHQRSIQDAAKLTIQSASLQHPYLACENVLKAKWILEHVLDYYGGSVAAEQALGFPSGRLDKLRQQVYKQHEAATDMLMATISAVQPELDYDLNEEAGLVKKKSRRRRHRRHK